MNYRIAQILQKGSATARRYPLVLACALIAVFCFILFLENENYYEKTADFTLLRIVYSSTLGISLFFGIKMLSERIGKELIMSIIGMFLVLFHYFTIVPHDVDNLSIKEMIFNVVWGILSHLSVAFLPFIFRKSTEKNFWEYNKNLFIHFFLASIFTGVFTGGGNLAILATDELFNLEISHKVYTYFTIFSGIFLHCFIFLSFANEGLRGLEKEETEYPKVLKFFTQFILIPLLIIYGIILYLYGGKIILTWELPQGWVSFMIMMYNSVGIFAYLLVYPLGKVNTKSWVKFYSKIFFYSVLPLLVLLYVAIFTRVLEYGVTENRYFVVLYAVWLTILVGYFILGRNSKIKFIPISLFILLVMSISTLYFNVFSMSIRSQKSELEKVFKRTKILEKGQINFSQKIAEKDAHHIADILEFLAKRGEKDYVLGFISAKDKVEFTKTLSQKYFSAYTIKNHFINQELDVDAGAMSNFKMMKFSEIRKLPKEYDNYIILNGDVYHIDNEDKITYEYTGIKLTKNNKVYEFNFEKDLKSYIERNKDKENPEPITFSLGKYDCQLLVSDIEYYEKGEEISSIRVSWPVLLLKEKK